MRSPGIKKGYRHIDLSAWRSSLVGSDLWLFGPQIDNTNCSRPDLPVKWAALILANVIYQVLLIRVVPGLFQNERSLAKS